MRTSAEPPSEHGVQPYTDIVRYELSDCKGEKLTHKHVKFANAKDAKFDHVDFSYSLFEFGYFRNAQFIKCRFVGTHFEKCNFRGAHFQQCDFRYCTFDYTLLESREIVANLPLEANLRKENLQNLRANAKSIGDTETLSLLNIEEINATKDYYKRAFFMSDSYYKHKYPKLTDRVWFAWKLMFFHVNNFLWGHGERPVRILFSLFTTLVMLSFVNTASMLTQNSITQISLGSNEILYVFKLFLGISAERNAAYLPIVDYLVAICRYLFVGLFISSLFKFISHR